MKNTKKLEKGQLVRFTEAYLERVSAADAKRLKGRIGAVTGYRLGATLPIVVFPKISRFAEIRMVEVDTDPRWLELIQKST